MSDFKNYEQLLADLIAHSGPFLAWWQADGVGDCLAAVEMTADQLATAPTVLASANGKTPYHCVVALRGDEGNFVRLTALRQRSSRFGK